MRYGSSNVGTDGEFNLIRVYNTVLSDAQVAQNYAVTVPPSLNYSQSGNQLTISWQSPYQGWILQQQTNGLNVGLGINWVDMAGTESVTTTNVPLNAAPVVFYRLRQP
jgi:hypothetical protein